jgi:hypothetical protein
MPNSGLESAFKYLTQTSTWASLPSFTGCWLGKNNTFGGLCDFNSLLDFYATDLS